MKYILQFDEGFTYEHLPHGFFIALLGAILAGVLHWAFVPILIAGILIAASKTGVQIDRSQRIMRKYTSWTIFKTGEWIHLDKLVRIELRSGQHGEGGTRVAGQTHTTAKTFDLILIDDTDDEIEFNQFVKVGLAFKTFDALQDLLDGVVFHNHVKDKIIAQKANRTQRSERG